MEREVTQKEKEGFRSSPDLTVAKGKMAEVRGKILRGVRL